jgi:hypothetical protein
MRAPASALYETKTKCSHGFTRMLRTHTDEAMDRNAGEPNADAGALIHAKVFVLYLCESVAPV